jgi:hypothetical protein
VTVEPMPNVPLLLLLVELEKDEDREDDAAE